MRWSSARDLPVVALLYASALAVSTLWLESLAPHIELQVLHDASTNLQHLTRDPWSVLPASAFFTRGGLVFALIGAALCVGSLERVAGWRMTIVVALSAHVIGTLVSEGIIAFRVDTGDLPESARELLDVGPSYIIVGCAAAVIAWRTTPQLLRIVVAVAIAPLFIFTAWRLPQGRVDAMGHVTAFVVGIGWAWLKRRNPLLGEEVRR